MKNVFFALVFMLVGSFAFANTNEVETVNENVTVENITTIDYQNFVNKVKSGDIVVSQVLVCDCFDFIFNDSCGGTWRVTGSGFSISKLIKILQAFDDAICG